ncbi:hypothetical protein Acr_00g0034070 [Actinidia rufa]|uniref:Uncharacterized protein n=1 Tax=Actinidia rufa TaxID=165716 RepID=A0A7J0DGB9_9ERIC|nr:hypothetical protein Acr_00g0034070 [Actinidia rufa]
MSSSKKSGSKLLALPCPPSPALEIVNRYQILGTIPKPTYTSVLASSQSSIAPMANPLQTFKSVIPTWFLKWWDFHGALPEILPPDLADQVTIFSTQYKVTAHYSHFPSLLLFMAKYKVPWIFKWQYNIANRLVIRQRFVKWWDAFKHPRIIDYVKLEFPVLVPAPVKQVPPAPASSVKQVPAAPAAPKSSYSTANLDSPSSSSKSGKTKSSKSKSKTPEFIQDNTELLRVANLLLAQVQAQAQSAIKEESASLNDSTAQSAQSESPDPYGLQDAQDPFA